MPHRCTSTSVSPGPGSGRGTSRTSNPRTEVNRVERIVALTFAPCRLPSGADTDRQLRLANASVVGQAAAVRPDAHAALAMLMALGIGCGTPAEPRLIWEGAGTPRAATASEWASTLAVRQPGVRAGAWGASPDATFQLLEARVPERPHVHDAHDLTVVLLRGRGVL